MKKFFVIMLVVAMMAPSVANASQLENLADDLGEEQFFPDVPTTHLNYLSIAWMSDEAYVDGYPDGTFGPDGLVNRAELMKMVLGPIDNPEQYKNCFPDVTDQWFAPYVCFAYENGVIDGYPDGTFKPGERVNRAEAMKIILNAHLSSERWPNPTDEELSLEMPVDVDTDAWYGPFARFAIAKELVDGQHVTQDADGGLHYYPGDNMTRKEVAEMMFRVIVYELERRTFVTIMSEASCYYAENMDSLTEEELHLGMIEVFSAWWYTEAEMDAFTLLFESDDVVQADLNNAIMEKCGPVGETGAP